MSDRDTSARLDALVVPTIWALRGDAADPGFVHEVVRRLGTSPPTLACTSVRAGSVTLLWTGPRAWLVLDAAPTQRDDYDESRRALESAGGALFDVSAGYALWRIEGAGAASALAALCPLDLHPRVFAAGHCAGSMLGHVAGLVHRPEQGDGFVVAVARSFARDVEDALRVAVASVNAANG